MWPRHTGDFSFYRAYVGKDGKPASFSKENIPYRPKHWLKFSDQPLGDGDFRDGRWLQDGPIVMLWWPNLRILLSGLIR